MHVEILNSWSNKSFDMLLELLATSFSMCSTTIPSPFYEAKRTRMTWIWDTRLFMRVSTTMYCIWRNLAIYNIVQRLVSLGTRLVLTKKNNCA